MRGDRRTRSSPAADDRSCKANNNNNAQPGVRIASQCLVFIDHHEGLLLMLFDVSLTQADRQLHQK